MRAVILIATLLACGRFAPAQATGRPNTRQGFWIGFGLGDGSAQRDCTYLCGSDRISGASGYVRAGGTLTPKVLLGGEANVWRHGDFGSDFVGAALLVVMWYPSPTGASYLKVGLGGMRYSRSRPTADHTGLSATAPTASLGVGYEVRVGRGVSLVPWVEVLATPAVALHYQLGFINIDPPTSPPEISINAVQAGLGLTWH
jgi:hypothetical protein